MSMAFATTAEPYRARYRLRQPQPGQPEQVSNGGRWNRTQQTDDLGDALLWFMPQAVGVRYGFQQRLEGALQVGWLSAGGSLRGWLVPLDAGETSLAMTLQGGHALFGQAWELGGALEVHRRLGLHHLWLATGASAGARRHYLQVPDAATSQVEGSLGQVFSPGGSRSVLRDETRLELRLGLSRLIGPADVGLTLSPHWVARRGNWTESCSEDCIATLESFDNRWGLTVALTVAGSLGSRPPAGPP